MSLVEQVAADLMAAMKARDDAKLSALRMLKAEFQKLQADKGVNVKIMDEDAQAVIRRLIKQRKEAAEQYVAAGRQELADNELAEAAVMEKYLPKQLSEAEVEVKIKEIIAQLGATSIKDMGKVMGTANKALAGLSDGRTISTIVKKLLS